MTIQVYPAAKSQVTSNFWRYTAVGGETTLTGVDNSGTPLYYYPNQEQVFLNGVLLVRGVDYTATSGTSITGLAALVAGDTVQINCYSNFTITQVPVSSLTGYISNLQLANSSVTIGSTLINLGNTTTSISALTLNNPITVTSSTGLASSIIKAITSQTSNLQEWQNTSGTALAYVNIVGSAYFTSLTASSSAYIANHSNIAAQNGLALGTVSKSTTPSGGQGVINIYSNDLAASQLQGGISLITDPTATNRRLSIGVIEQGTGWRNITLAENGGYVGIGKTNPSVMLDVNGTINGTSVTVSGASVATVGKAIAMAMVFGG